MERYNLEEYPSNNGLIVSGVMFRKHNSQDIIKSILIVIFFKLNEFIYSKTNC